jgi:hypothetical protein
MCSRTKATDKAAIRYRNSSVSSIEAYADWGFTGFSRQESASGRHVLRPIWMTVLPLSLFMLHIVVFFLPLTVVAFQRKRSESLSGLLLRIDLRRGTLRCQARPDLAVDTAGSTSMRYRNFCRRTHACGLGVFHVSKPLQHMEDETFHAAIWSVHILSQIFI